MIQNSKYKQWRCRSCHEIIEEDSVCSCGEGRNFFSYRGFKLKRTGGFMSNDGCLIYAVPDWVPLKNAERAFDFHYQDCVMLGVIDKACTLAEKHGVETDSC